MAATGVSDAFVLPAQLEANEPPEARGLKRDDVRLLVSQIDTDSIVHSRFNELPRWLTAGDLLVVNTSGTLKAALKGRTKNGERFELHLSTRLPGNFWVIEVRRPGPVASLPFQGALAGTIFELEGGARIALLAPSVGWTSSRDCGSLRWSFRNQC
jgi:S-adenosylmethionine:tRNA ribosyltransferase-isomerase